MKTATAEDVLDLMDAWVTSTALNTALELGLFWLLAERPLDAAGLAAALGIPKGRCRSWLQLLGTTGLIERGAAGYVPTATAQTAILGACSRDTWKLLAEGARSRYPSIFDLTTQISRDGSVWEAQGLTPPDYFTQMQENPERARRFTCMLYEIHLPLAEALAESLDMSEAKRLLDLGGGSGVMSMALLRRHPGLTAVVVDIANVCAAGREILAEAGWTQSDQDRLTFHAANYVHDELPSGFDTVLLCDVGGYEDEATLHKIRGALKPAGRLVIVDHFAPERGLAPSLPPYPVWAFLGSLQNPNLSRPTLPDTRTRLQRAGFQPLSERLLPQKGSLRWTEGWTLLEARR